jgi:hypothetical protein
MVKKAIGQGVGMAAVAGLLVCLVAGSVAAVEVHRFANGITATVYTPEEITSQMTTQEKGNTYLVHPGSGPVELTGTSEIFHPFSIKQVIASLEAMHGFVTEVEVDVFVLPAVPTEAMSSFARRNAIYLAPGRHPVDLSTQAYVVTHEMGHVLTWAFLDEQPKRWKDYLDIRGLDETSLRADLNHADRAREILAEDIRALFGGPLATGCGCIENQHLVHPQRVEGLQDMLAGFFLGKETGPVQITSQAFPNPCNPRTTIEMIIPEGQDVEGRSGILRIFDIRGNLIRTLTGGHQANGRLSLQWDGTNRAGNVVASGRYLYVIEIGQVVSKGAVTLVR